MVKHSRFGCPVDPSILLDQLRYDPETGHLWWRERRQGRPRFSHAGQLGVGGERYIRIGGRKLKASVIVWAMHTGKKEFGPIRKINNWDFDNRIENLQDLWDPDFRPPALGQETIIDFL